MSILFSKMNLELSNQPPLQKLIWELSNHLPLPIAKTPKKKKTPLTNGIE